MHEFNLDDSISYLIGLKEPLEALIKMNGHNIAFKRSLGGLLVQYRLLLDVWRCGFCEFALNGRKNNERDVCQLCLYYTNYIKKDNKEENEIQ